MIDWAELRREFREASLVTKVLAVIGAGVVLLPVFGCVLMIVVGGVAKLFGVR